MYEKLLSEFERTCNENNQLRKNKKEMIPLTKEEEKTHCKQKNVIYAKKDLVLVIIKIKKNFKIRDHCHDTGKYRGSAHDTSNLRYKTSKEFPVVFHNGATYDYQFIIKELAEEFERQIECLGENTEKYLTFSAPVKKELDNGKSITYKIKFIDSFRFMSSSLSNIVDNLSEGLHSDKCTDCKSCRRSCNQLIFRCFDCKKEFDKRKKNLIKN